MAPITSPLATLKSAIKAVPAVKYALGIAGIVAAIAIVGGFRIDFRIAVFGTLIMFVLMTTLVIFAKTAGSNIGVGPTRVLTWFSLILMMATATALFTSVFFKWPVNLQWVLQKRDFGTNDKPGNPKLQPFQPAQNEKPSAVDDNTIQSHEARKVGSQKKGPTVEPERIDEFVGLWESDELTEPLYTIPEQRCVQDLTRKFKLQVVQATQEEYAARFWFESTGSTHMQKVGEVLIIPPCASSIAPFHGEHNFPAFIIGVSNHILSLQVNAWQKNLVLKFHHATEERLVALPGGVDALLNNENRASLSGNSMALYRR